jgi:phosphatidylserine/phosphatidylglycerophosphate/cardiolipin synthase-like enzyme
LFAALTTAGCSFLQHPSPTTPAAAPLTPAAAPSPGNVELVESFPIETTLDHPDIPDAAGVWLEMIQSAHTSLDFGEFYATNRPGSRLDAVMQAVFAAADRGVKVRFLADAKFAQTEPATLAVLAAHKGVELRKLDLSGLSGGILHAKYFLVDGREAYFGSQNFDWRSLEHIQELGVRVSVPSVVRAIDDVFETDWAIAGGDRGHRAAPPADGYHFPVVPAASTGSIKVTPVFSPKGLFPDERLWELPRIVHAIDEAKQTVRVQLLTYNAAGFGAYWDELESALRRAAVRKVQVQLLVADWGKRRGTIEGLKSLQVLPNISVKLVTIPPWSGGFIPFARVIHAKYMVVDGQLSWVGTSNWERGYFYGSRNVGLFIEGATFAERLDRFFLDGWNSAYAVAVDPSAEYEPPKTR